LPRSASFIDAALHQVSFFLHECKLFRFVKSIIFDGLNGACVENKVFVALQNPASPDARAP
jgi:hypothetical protein